MSKIEKIVLGTVQFGLKYGVNSAGRPDAEMVRQILQSAADNGIITLDTSSAYGNSEEILGNCKEDDRFKIISKYPKGESSVQAMFDGSLTRLKTERLYGYLLHHFEVYRNDPIVWEEFLKLKAEGKVSKIGFSLYTPEELEMILNNDVQFDLLQIPYNIFDRKFEPYLEELHDKGVEVHVRSTFLQGLFFKDREKLPEKLQPLKKYLLDLDAYAKEKGLSTSELALNYNLQNPYLDGVLIGVDNVQQLLINIHSIIDAKVDIDIEVKEKELLNPVNWN